MGLGDAAHARQPPDGPLLVRGGVHPVLRAQQAPQQLGVLAHASSYLRTLPAALALGPSESEGADLQRPVTYLGQIRACDQGEVACGQTETKAAEGRSVASRVGFETQTPVSSIPPSM